MGVSFYPFRVSELQVTSLNVNKSGDWLALACGHGTEGQLIVWEWQSETYIMKQQSHSQLVTTVAYSPDGSQIATGAEDGKVSILKSSLLHFIDITDALGLQSVVGFWRNIF